MATLTSSSTDAEVWAEYDDTASYEEDASVSKAKRFVTACRILLRRRPTISESGSKKIEFDSELIASETSEARRWLAINGEPSSLATSVISTSFEDFR